MAEALQDADVRVDVPELELDVRSLHLSDRNLFNFCAQNKTWRIERTASGKLLVMWPAGPAASSGNADLTSQFYNWARRDKTGRMFGPDAGFILPNKAMRSPDISWVRSDRLKKVTPRGDEGFLPLCPDFALELRSRTDRMALLHQKMVEYIENGARLGWLLDYKSKDVFVYRPNSRPQKLEEPETVEGGDVLRGFVLDVRRVWAAMEW